MYVLGVDLAGPANRAETAVALFQSRPPGLQLLHARTGAGDADILALAANAGTPLIVGLDAPLSYQPGGGDRPADRRLRQVAQAAGMSTGSVMPPTLTRMVYLTVRGISVARMLSTLDPPPRIVEVHPGAAMVLRGAPLAVVRALKAETTARCTLRDWLAEQQLHGLEELAAPSDHLIAALAAALASWRWVEGAAVWHEPAQPPHHPFDYAA